MCARTRVHVSLSLCVHVCVCVCVCVCVFAHARALFVRLKARLQQYTSASLNRTTMVWQEVFELNTTAARAADTTATHPAALGNDPGSGNGGDGGVGGVGATPRIVEVWKDFTTIPKVVAAGLDAVMAHGWYLDKQVGANNASCVSVYTGVCVCATGRVEYNA